jgi:hypothetical protein
MIKNKEEEFDKISKLKSRITELIRSVPNKEFPFVLTFNEMITHPRYRITIEVIEEDSFIDSEGRKWVKADV